MENSALPWLLIIAIASLCLLVGFVVGFWSPVSAATRRRKPPPSPPAMSDFEIRFAKVEADQVELFSTLARLTKSMQRLSSRAGMEALRERKADATPPEGTSKAALRRHYGLTGLTPAEFARRQLQMPIEAKEE